MEHAALAVVLAREDCFAELASAAAGTSMGSCVDRARCYIRLKGGGFGYDL